MQDARLSFLPRLTVRAGWIVAVVAVMAFALMPRAAAHDVLLSSDPEDGETVETSPEEVTLEFSGNLQDIAPSAVLATRDGTTVDEFEPVISGTTATVELPDLEPDIYDLVWSVVSSDGHRIDGIIVFTVAGTADDDEAQTEDEAAPEDDEAAPEETGDVATDNGEPATDEDEADAEEPDTTVDEVEAGDPADESTTGWLPWILGGAGAALILAIIIFVVSRRDASAQGSDAADETPDANA